jgi:hypothetical protein
MLLLDFFLQGLYFLLNRLVEREVADVKGGSDEVELDTIPGK